MRLDLHNTLAHTCKCTSAGSVIFFTRNAFKTRKKSIANPVRAESVAFWAINHHLSGLQSDSHYVIRLIANCPRRFGFGFGHSESLIQHSRWKYSQRCISSERLAHNGSEGLTIGVSLLTWSQLRHQNNPLSGIYPCPSPFPQIVRNCRREKNSRV